MLLASRIVDQASGPLNRQAGAIVGSRTTMRETLSVAKWQDRLTSIVLLPAQLPSVDH